MPLKDLEKRKEYKAEYYKKNIENLKLGMKQNYENNSAERIVKQKEYYEKNKYDILKKHKGFYNKQLNTVYGVRKAGAKRRGYEWSLTKNDFSALWKKPCSYCGDAIETIGLDRQDNTIGYEANNVIACCKTCNSMKGTMTVKQFVNKIKNILNKMEVRNDKSIFY